MKLAQRMINASAVVLFASVMYACGGGNGIANGTLSQADFNKLLAASAAFTGLQAAADTLKTQQAADEVTLTRIAQFGHSPDAKSAQSVATRSMSSSPVLTQAITYGPCADMGQHIGDSGFAPNTSTLESTIETFKQCPINGAQYEYAVAVFTGAIAEPDAIWFSGANCTGDAIENQDQFVFNRQVLASGVVFASPSDGAILMVRAGQTAATMHSLSNYASGSCNNTSETHMGYIAEPNDIQVTGVPNGVPADFVF